MYFPDIDRYVKLSLCQMMITWNETPPFGSILFDSKFVALLLVGVIGKERLAADNFVKADMRFIKGRCHPNKIHFL